MVQFFMSLTLMQHIIVILLFTFSIARTGVEAVDGEENLHHAEPTSGAAS